MVALEQSVRAFIEAGSDEDEVRLALSLGRRKLLAEIYDALLAALIERETS